MPTRIAERKLHLVAVAELSGACHDPLEHRIKISACRTDDRGKQLPDLLFFQRKLIFIAQMLIGTAAACTEMHTGHVCNRLYYSNELLGRIALFPEKYSDLRTKSVVGYMRRNILTILRHHRKIGFSLAGSLMLLLPAKWYLRYRHSKI